MTETVGPDAHSARRVAFEAVLAVVRDDAYGNLVLPGLLRAARLDPRDAALATELGYGCMRAGGTLDEIVRECSSRPPEEMDLDVLVLLRLGSYQLLRTRVARHAAVATTVDLAREVGQARAAGFVNAVLRRVSERDWDAWCERIAGSASPIGRLAVRHSHPGWIVQGLASALGDESVTGEEIVEALRADNVAPVTHLIAWPDRMAREDLVAESGGTAGPYSPWAVRLSGGNPADLASLGSHRAAVQDEGSQLCALFLLELPIEGSDANWLDLCAGPGGKAAALASVATRTGAVLTANELHPHRAQLVRQATDGWDVTVREGSAETLAAETRQRFDRVLLDAPCTGLGALRRRPEARWRKTPADLDELTALQSRLLDAALELTRPGGVVGYVTCSPHPAETTDRLDDVLERRPDVDLIDVAGIADRLGLADAVTDSGALQLWPHRHGTDAMFFAGLRRR